jgi:hypothetical protein
MCYAGGEALAADCADDVNWSFVYAAAPLTPVSHTGATFNPARLLDRRLRFPAVASGGCAGRVVYLWRRTREMPRRQTPGVPMTPYDSKPWLANYAAGYPAAISPVFTDALSMFRSAVARATRARDSLD